MKKNIVKILLVVCFVFVSFAALKAEPSKKPYKNGAPMTKYEYTVVDDKGRVGKVMQMEDRSLQGYVKGTYGKVPVSGQWDGLGVIKGRDLRGNKLMLEVEDGK